jgi:hypothetical protein
MVVNTQINSSERNRPKELQDPGASKASISEVPLTVARVIEPTDVADRVVAAIRANSLYILTHQESRDILKRRAERLDRAAERYGTA